MRDRETERGDGRTNGGGTEGGTEGRRDVESKRGNEYSHKRVLASVHGFCLLSHTEPRGPNLENVSTKVIFCLSFTGAQEGVCQVKLVVWSFNVHVLPLFVHWSAKGRSNISHHILPQVHYLRGVNT